METELIFKIASVGIVVAIINILLSKAGRDEHVLMVTIAGAVIVLAMLAEKILTLLTSLQSLFKM
jgi:stage III sporulation protein AC